jgi:uncharacterized protein (TIGR02246 family)
MRRACIRIAALLAACGLATAGCTNVKQVSDGDLVRETIEGLNQELVECWNNAEYECVAAMFSEEGWQLMPNAQAQAGTEAVRRFWQQAFGWGQWEFSMETSLLEQSGPVAVERGTYAIRFTADAAAPPGRPSSQDRGNYLTHWRLDSDGRWRIAAQALVSEVPARVVPAAPMPGPPGSTPGIQPGVPPGDQEIPPQPAAATGEIIR